MVDEQARNWGARLVAPIVFFAAVTVLVLLVQNSFGDDGSTSTPITVTVPADGSAAGAGAEPAGSGAGARKQSYRVKSGDTLESIAQQFGTTVADLLELNPKIDPLALRPDQKIRIR